MKSLQHNKQRKVRPPAISMMKLLVVRKELSTYYSQQHPADSQLIEAIEVLTRALEPHTHLLLGQLIGSNSANGERSGNRRQGLLANYEVSRISDLDFGTIEQLLRDIQITKGDLVRLGHLRFGIPVSKFHRLSKQKTLELLTSALAHEESLQVIATKAKGSGEERRS